MIRQKSRNRLAGRNRFLFVFLASQCLSLSLDLSQAHAMTLRYVFKKGNAWAWRFTWTGKETTQAGSTSSAVESTVHGMIVQRVESAQSDGTYVLSVDVRVEDVRMVSDGKVIPPRSTRFSERSMLRITSTGRIISVNPLSSSLPGGLQALRQIAIIQFPESDVKVGDTWEVQAVPGAAAMTAKLDGIEVVEGRFIARIILQSEIPLQSTSKVADPEEKAQPVKMHGRINLSGTQEVETKTGITVNAHADLNIELEIRNPGEEPMSQRSVIVLDAKAAPVPAPTLVTPPKKPPARKPAVSKGSISKSKASAPIEKPRAGEIRIDGTVLTIQDDGTITVAVQSFMTDRGRSTKLPAPKPKSIQLTENTKIGQRNVKGALSKEALTPGSRISVIGQDLGTGKPLPARKVTIETPPSGPPRRR